ncbi:hypothetical protein BV22DRAFT_1039898 [Leucogyrophana mollusca]|uniref:Uncharacterized protein n=1 Tax=Leucogyrophana mollusca TaxID=85980 RepID=A0ACB8B3T8_9AGAM|nr:hypothetical protein BV22DRAFT_1039898 [Leucogyrophana mollusca]
MSQPDGHLPSHPQQGQKSLVDGPHDPEQISLDGKTPRADEDVSTGASESGFSFSSNSSGEVSEFIVLIAACPHSGIVGTPFDIGARRYEYPFPEGHSPTSEAFSPLSSSITSASSSLPNSPQWPFHISSKSFPLAAPPISKLKVHPKLRAANAREPPVPPGLVKKRHRLSADLQPHSGDEGQQSDASEVAVRSRKHSRFSMGLTGLDQMSGVPSDSDTGQSSYIGTETAGATQGASTNMSAIQRKDVAKPEEKTEQPPAVSVDLRVNADGEPVGLGCGITPAPLTHCSSILLIVHLLNLVPLASTRKGTCARQQRMVQDEGND